MDKSSDPNAPKNQHWDQAPDDGRNWEGDIVTDSTESTDQHSDWESSADLEIEEITNDEGYSSGPSDYGTAVHGG